MRLLRAIVCITAVAAAACAAHVEASQTQMPLATQSPVVLAEVPARAPEAPTGRHLMATRAAAQQPANMTRTAVDLDRPSGRAILSAYEIAGDGSNGAAGTVQPGIGVWDERTERVSADRQINVPPDGNFTTATSNAGHDAPAIVLTPDDGVLIAYGAASTYRSYHPPEAWSCLRAQFCQPFKFAPNDARSSTLAETLARSPEYLLPASGLSEMSSATLGNETLLAGQQQVSTGSGEAGAQGFVTYERGGTFETAAGPWNFRSSHVPPADGLYTISRTPGDGAYVEFAVTAASGSGSMAIDIGGTRCALSNLPAQDPASAADAFAQYANSSCPAFRARFEAIVPRYDPLERGTGGTAIGIAVRGGDVATLPPASAVHLECAGGIVCASPAGQNRVYDVRASGLHRHFLFGGLYRLGRYIYDLVDIQQVTGSWFGPEHNSFALALACFRTSGASGATWTWTDCAGRHPFELRPGAAPAARLERGSPYLIGPPPSYPANYAHYIYDFSMHAQPPATAVAYPVISSESMAQLRDGSIVIAHGCQSASQSDAICYVEVDPRNGRTTRAGFVDAAPGGGSLASIALRSDGRGGLALGALAGIASKWGCGGSGGCALVYRFNAANGTWSRYSAQSLGGSNDAGFAGTVAASARGFLFSYKELEGSHARIVTFERSAP